MFLIGVLKVVGRSFKSFLRMLQGCLKMILWGVKGVLMVLHGCFSAISRVSQGCFKGFLCV